MRAFREREETIDALLWRTRAGAFRQARRWAALARFPLSFERLEIALGVT
jgi:hypothetical protein